VLRSGIIIEWKSFELDEKVEFERWNKFIEFKEFDFYRLFDKFEFIFIVEILRRRIKPGSNKRNDKREIIDSKIETCWK
jgi:hypothetical protein